MEKKPDLIIPMDHMPVLINSSIAEAMLQTERRLNAAGQFEWRWRDGDGAADPVWTEWAETPPLDFFGNADVALKLVAKFCEQNGLTLEMQLAPGGVWAARIGRITGEGTAEVVGKPVMMATAPQALAMVICSVIKVDLAARHRELFPGHYLVLQ